MQIKRRRKTRGKGYSGTSVWSKTKPVNVYNSYNDFKNEEGDFN